MSLTDRHKSLLGAAGRVIVGAILVYAGAAKAAGPTEEFALIISYYQLLPRDMVMTVASFLPWLEVLVGWALLLGVSRRAAATAAGALFGGFLVALLSVLARGIELPNCGCFGDSVHFTIPQALLFDSVMLALSWAALLHGGAFSLDKWVDGGYTPRGR
ncbi:MAG: MauE/DoxX family redox-associated membrane protein [Elusimicrobiota bacterium]|nr:MauE/DoxX family redox-associated membrane protein [Elusimicrobiota bacterium]